MRLASFDMEDNLMRLRLRDRASKLTNLGSTTLKIHSRILTVESNNLKLRSFTAAIEWIAWVPKPCALAIKEKSRISN
jgi:hypothetical protein